MSTALECTTDHATLWAVGRLEKEQSHTFSVPLPAVMSDKAQPHAISATVAWFAPPRVGTANYRDVRLKFNEPSEAATTFAVKGAKDQPDANQARRGTVIHRRWVGHKAAALGADANFEVIIQRQPDETDDPIPYAVVLTVVMPDVAEVYSQVRARVAVKPKVKVLPFGPVEPAAHLPHLAGRFLVISDETDRFVPTTAAAARETLTPNPKTIVRLPGDHIGVGPDQRVLLATIIWTSRTWLIREGAINPR